MVHACDVENVRREQIWNLCDSCGVLFALDRVNLGAYFYGIVLCFERES